MFVDGDACPVKDEVYRVAGRHDLKVFVVSHGALRVPGRGRVEHVRVAPALDAADDWIAEHSGKLDVVITSDIPLASRCLKNGSVVISPIGTQFTEDSIGEAIAGRDLMDQLRQMGVNTGGPPAFTAADRTRFLARLGDAIHTIQRLRRDPD